MIRDNDNGDCANQKRRLWAMVEEAGLAERTKVRIVCQ
jgi:hypothetical protein